MSEEGPVSARQSAAKFFGKEALGFVTEGDTAGWDKFERCVCKRCGGPAYRSQRDQGIWGCLRCRSVTSVPNLHFVADDAQV